MGRERPVPPGAWRAAADVQPSGTLPYWSPDGKLIASITNDNKLEVSDVHGTVVFTADGATDNKLSWQTIRSGS